MSDAMMIAPPHLAEAAPLLRREFVLDEGHGDVERAGFAQLDGTFADGHAVRWDLDHSGLRVEVRVPDGTEAIRRLTGETDEIVGAGVHHRAAPVVEREGSE
jgi:hypothetical protein